jgi:hypothetical protein
MSDYQLAATELALLHQKASRGVIDDRQFTENQRALLGLMQQARAAFLRRQPGPPSVPWAGAGPSGFTQSAAFAAPMPQPATPRDREPG